jgi:hypothetical protein
MTNTLHRFGKPEANDDDYIVFAIPCRGVNDHDCVPKLQEFLRRAVKHNPVNMGDASHGALFRPDRHLTPLAHWFRREKRDYSQVVETVSGSTTVAVVFDNPMSVEAFIRELRQADLGLSVNLSAPVHAARKCCRATGLVPHSVEHALSPMGRTGALPEERTLALTTMCGHGMISSNFARKMIDWVRAGRRSPEQASEYLCRFCSCGAFNPSRATRILREVARGG